MIKKKDDELAELMKIGRFTLTGLDSRSTFLEVKSSIEEASKSLLTITGLIFAGSLTFLGLRENVSDARWLKYAWAALAVSLVAHLFLKAAIVDAHMAHSRTEISNNKATAFSAEPHGDPARNQAVESFRHDGAFRKSAKFVIGALVLQHVFVIVGVGLMTSFLWSNL